MSINTHTALSCEAMRLGLLFCAVRRLSPSLCHHPSSHFVFQSSAADAHLCSFTSSPAREDGRAQGVTCGPWRPGGGGRSLVNPLPFSHHILDENTCF